MSQIVAMCNALASFSRAWPYRVTFTKAAQTKGSAGGNVLSNPVATSSDVPCIIRPSTNKEIQLAGKTVSGVLYSIIVPASYSNELVSVDSKCQAIVAATDGGEPGRSFNVVAPLRQVGLQITVLATIEE